MASPITFEQRNRTFQVWSGRQKRAVVVELDYHRIQAGEFTLFQISSLKTMPTDDSGTAPPMRIAA